MTEECAVVHEAGAATATGMVPEEYNDCVVTRSAVLISTYEMGRQPFGVASAAAWLRSEGWSVACLDLAKERLREADVASADLVAFHLPMHTATRLAGPVIARVHVGNPAARLCAFGLYAPLNDEWLRSLGVTDVLGGEFEEDLAAIARELGAQSAQRPQSRSGTFGAASGKGVPTSAISANSASRRRGCPRSTS